MAAATLASASYTSAVVSGGQMRDGCRGKSTAPFRRFCRLTTKRGEVGGRCAEQWSACWRPELPRRRRRIAALSALDDEVGEVTDVGDLKKESSSPEDDAGKVAQVDLQLPRRRLLVEFTCNVCQTRSQRLVNPDAYKRGTVYVQCAGCEAYHQLVDNLGLVVEYDFRGGSDSESS